ncbi:MAG TPA: STAS domain-containing protein [Ilumatobacter sp.]
MDLQVGLRHVGDEVVVVLAGVADLSTTPTLHQHLHRASADHPGRTLVVDLDGLIALDDAALGVLLGAAAHAREAGGDLALVCTNDRLRARLITTRLDRCIALRDRITPAVGSDPA